MDSSSSSSSSNEDSHVHTTAGKHFQSPSWEGWNSPMKRFGLEVQMPYAQYLLEGTKTIETRNYPLPRPLWGKRIDILESMKGVNGVSSIPHRVELAVEVVLPSSSSSSSSSYVTRDDTNQTIAANTTRLHRKGWCTFIHCFQYTTREQFEADEQKHLVKNTPATTSIISSAMKGGGIVSDTTSCSSNIRNSLGYGWDDARKMYGWIVGSYGVYDNFNDENDRKQQPPPLGEDVVEAQKQFYVAERRMRSLFEITFDIKSINP